MPAIKTFDSDVKIWFPMAHWILSKKSFLPRLFVNEHQVYAISFPSLVYLSLSTNTATPPRGDYVQVSGVLQTGRQCSES